MPLTHRRRAAGTATAAPAHHRTLPAAAIATHATRAHHRTTAHPGRTLPPTHRRRAAGTATHAARRHHRAGPTGVTAAHPLRTAATPILLGSAIGPAPSRVAVGPTHPLIAALAPAGALVAVGVFLVVLARRTLGATGPRAAGRAVGVAVTHPGRPLPGSAAETAAGAAEPPHPGPLAPLAVVPIAIGGHNGRAHQGHRRHRGQQGPHSSQIPSHRRSPLLPLQIRVAPCVRSTQANGERGAILRRKCRSAAPAAQKLKFRPVYR